MSRVFSTGEFYCIVDKDENPIAVDRDSGGVPYVAATPNEIKMWRGIHLRALQQYLRVINYGDKGYMMARIVVNPPEIIRSE